MQESQLTELVEPILAEHGLELDSLDVTPVGKRKLLRITVDGDGPAGRGPLLDDISAASARISAALDSSTAVGQAPFTLEVTSRGVGKPLTEAKHYRRNTGRLVRLWLGGAEVTGRIVGVDGEVVTLDVEGREESLPLTEISKAVVQVEMNPPKEFRFDSDDTPKEA
ncbi:ribosome maturation factor RimP [Tessaracoccus sp. OS52]|uniref:ribosome maturation factor RimP n=1 Tax=Tessaracoccus sp. OS52 TaxID=2886691 RepID=UPI001D10CA51|nr:ribosome maturation factor RimP [Tessaracoccus sp. OS52]MCC2593292.1 ribosome maturation factor RimP [Tessaracoccus sp. OS52]